MGCGDPEMGSLGRAHGDPGERRAELEHDVCGGVALAIERFEEARFDAGLAVDDEGSWEGRAHDHLAGADDGNILGDIGFDLGGVPVGPKAFFGDVVIDAKGADHRGVGV